MIINHNMAAMNTHRQLGSNNAAAANNIEKLSSGLKINKAGDDAAGLAISEKMRGQIRGLDMAAKNSQDGISLIQTAEGSLNETHDILQRMRELAVQAGNDTNTTTDRQEVQKELNSLTSEINRIGNTTEFNTQKLLNGEKDTAKAATASTVTGTDISASLTSSTDFSGDNIGELKINDTVVTLTTVNALGAGDADTTIKVVAALNTDLETAFPGTDGAAQYEASVGDDGNIVIKNKVAGKDSLTISGAGATTLGIAGEAKGTAAATGKGLDFQIGANENQSMKLDIADMRASALGLTNAGTDEKLGVTDGTSNVVSEQALDVSSHEAAATAVTKIQAAIDQVSGERSKLGATQNRLEHTINNLGTSSENLTAAESRIRDVDYVLAA